jgi:hypothetical protein
MYGQPSGNPQLCVDFRSNRVSAGLGKETGAPAALQERPPRFHYSFRADREPERPGPGILLIQAEG